jgi:hypothetical protein
MRVTAACTSCNRHKVLDLEALRDRFGPDAPAMAADIAPKLRCDRCGSRKGGLIYAPAETNRVTTLGSPFAKVKGG